MAVRSALTTPYDILNGRNPLIVNYMRYSPDRMPSFAYI